MSLKNRIRRVEQRAGVGEDQLTEIVVLCYPKPGSAGPPWKQRWTLESGAFVEVEPDADDLARWHQWRDRHEPESTHTPA